MADLESTSDLQREWSWKAHHWPLVPSFRRYITFFSWLCGVELDKNLPLPRSTNNIEISPLICTIIPDVKIEGMCAANARRRSWSPRATWRADTSEVPG